MVCINPSWNHSNYLCHCGFCCFYFAAFAFFPFFSGVNRRQQHWGLTLWSSVSAAIGLKRIWVGITYSNDLTTIMAQQRDQNIQVDKTTSRIKEGSFSLFFPSCLAVCEGSIEIAAAASKSQSGKTASDSCFFLPFSYGDQISPKRPRTQTTREEEEEIQGGHR